MTKSSSDYERGYRAGLADAREALARTLRLYRTTEELSDRMMRDIFAGVFDVRQSDEEFGPDQEFAALALA